MEGAEVAVRVGAVAPAERAEEAHRDRVLVERLPAHRLEVQGRLARLVQVLPAQEARA